jgi:hypothetical protein
MGNSEQALIYQPRSAAVKGARFIHQGVRVMRKQDNPPDSGTHFSDIWTNAQLSRSAFVGAFLRNAWRRLFASAARDDEQSISNARQDLGA